MKPRKEIWMTAVAFVAAVALFAVGVTDGHISMDDWGYIYGCPFVRGGLTAANVKSAFVQFGYDAFWMPLTFVSYMADITLFGGGWKVHHAVNAVLHGIDAALVFVFLRMLLSRVLGRGESAADSVACLLAAVLWALHPMRAEAVTYVAARKELLWALFSLWGLAHWVRRVDGGGAVHYWAAFACFCAACLSKPTAMCFPLLAYATHQLLARKAYVGFLAYLPFLGVSFLLGLVTLYAQANPIGAERLDLYGESLGWRVLNAAVAFGMYAWHTLVPSGVHFDYRAVFGGRPVDLVLGLSTLAAALAALAAAAWRFRGGTAARAALFAALWFALALAPVSGVFGVVNGDHAYADRYSYVPCVAVAFLLALAAARALERGRSAAVAGAFVALAAAEVAFAVPVVRSFHDDYTAFARVLEKDPGHWRALRVVGNEYCARLGRMDEGVEMLRHSLALRDSRRTADSLAYVLAVRGAPGDFDEVKRLGRAVGARPALDRQGMMLEALAIASMRQGAYADASRYFEASLRSPERAFSNHHAILNLGLSLANSGERYEALKVLERLKSVPEEGIRRRAAEAMDAIRSGADFPPFEWRADPGKDEEADGKAQPQAV